MGNSAIWTVDLIVRARRLGGMLSFERYSPDTHTAEEVVEALGLEVLDREGGYFRRTAESDTWVKPLDGVENGTGKRRAYSIIYSLITSTGFSAMHRLSTDEIWCWHAGDCLESLRLYEDGSGEWVSLSDRVKEGARVQDVVRAGVWQGTRIEASGRWALASCIVAPEFHWEDFELGNQTELSRRYPNFTDDIATLSRTRPMAGMQ